MQTHMTVARVRQYTKDKGTAIGKHNERKNTNYNNLNVNLDRTHLNVSYAGCGNMTYGQRFDQMVESKEISLRGLRKDAKVLDEMIIDVNSEYFEEHGGYDFAKKFYKDMYDFAKMEYGEKNILSAVMHADEINQVASEKYGHAVYHYHMHVVAVPVVDKEIRYSSRCANPELVGTVKDIVHQVSHSKKWARVPVEDYDGTVLLDENGKPVTQASYSVLQDDLANFCRMKGYGDLERGERKSDKEHLEDLEFKIQKDQERLKKLDQEVMEKQNLVQSAREAKKEVQRVMDEAEEDYYGSVYLSQENYDTLTQLASGAANEMRRAEAAERELEKEREKVSQLQKAYEALHRSYEAVLAMTENIRNALHEYPEKIKGFLRGLFHNDEALQDALYQVFDSDTKEPPKDDSVDSNVEEIAQEQNNQLDEEDIFEEDEEDESFDLRMY